MKILLTGGSGQVGSEIRRLGGDFGFTLLAPDSASLDIRDLNAIRNWQARERADLFINAAAYTAVDKAESESREAFDVNATGAGNLAQIAAESGTPVLHISTDYVYDGSASVPCTEASETRPLGIYGQSKLEGEKLVMAATPKHLILRTSWVFGSVGQNFVKTMLRLAREKEALSVVADQTGSPTWAGHIALALLTMAKRYEQNGSLPWGIFNFSDTDPTTWHGFACTIMDLATESGLLLRPPEVHPIKTSDYPTAAARPAYSVLDCSRFVQAFPEIGISSWESGLREMIAVLSEGS